MKIRNFDLIQIINILNIYIEKKLPQKINYAIMRNFFLLSQEYDFYNKQYLKLIDEFKDKIEKDENNNIKIEKSGLPVFLNDHDRVDFSEPLNELLNIEIDMNFFTINESDFNYDDSGKYDVISGRDILNLKQFLCKNSE